MRADSRQVIDVVAIVIKNAFRPANGRLSGHFVRWLQLISLPDSIVRRKPLAFAADAVGLWGLNVAEAGCGRTREW